jgi:two-component system, cell cycle sensor histidine kinase and response regulator CckA
MLCETRPRADQVQMLELARSLMEALPLLVWTCTTDGACDYLSRQWLEFTGVPASEQLGTGWLNALHPNDRDRASAAWYNAVRGQGGYDLEYRLRRHDGLYRWFKTRGVAQMAPDGAIAGWIGTCTDIEDQKNAEQRFSGLLDSISDAVFIIDHTWRYVFVNAPAAAFANMSPAEMGGREVWDMFPKEKGSIFEISAVRAFQTGQEVRYETFSEQTGRWYEMDIFPDRTNIIVFARDITGRRALEQKIQEADKFDSIALLAGGVAHDFNNLLVGIMGNVSLALDILPESSPVRVMLEDAVIASERAALLTRQLLAYAGKGQFKLENLDLSRMVRDTRQLIRAKIPSHAELKLFLDDRLPAVEGDFSQIQQVIMNLVINAAEAIAATQPGQVRVHTSVDEIPGTHDLASGRYVSLKVEDEGCGMAPETVSRIFEPFFTTKFTGRGLGLAAVQGIVRSHKGKLHVESSPGKGSAFTVLLPACTNGGD